MCGIVGRISKSETAENTVGWTALAELAHRGPDGCGDFNDGRVWFGHRRLSILDLTNAGRQPMTTPDRRFIICYNGEIYNFREVAAQFALAGLRSRSDTEVLLNAFAAKGVEALPALNGIFAFAIYDAQRQRVWLVRDRLGVKPLYYACNPDGLVFASEIKSILTLCSDHASCNVLALHEWLYYGNTLGGKTLYAGVRQLQPGHYLEVDTRTCEHRVVAYWSLKDAATRARPDQTDPAVQPMSTVIGETRRLLQEAVRRQLVSDVPVAVFLSGGVDSTAITAFASRHYAGRLTTFSAGFDDARGVDERPKARRIAQFYDTDHHELQISGGDVPSLVEKMVDHHDLPFADAANIPLYQMARQISDTTKVVLQGDGGDELFGGYRRYVTLRQAWWLRPAARLTLPALRWLPDSNTRARIRRYAEAFATHDLGKTMALLLTLERAAPGPAVVFSSPFRQVVQQSDPFARYREVQALFGDRDIGNQMSLVDLTILLPDIFLEKVDRATMAASLEVRVPLLDDELVDYVVRVPGPKKMPFGRKKWLLKQALRGIVPDEVLSAPKTGFNVPFAYWLQTTLRPFFLDHLAAFNKANPGIVDVPLLTRWFEAHGAGRREHAHLLWKMTNFFVWCNNKRIAIVS